MPKNQTIKISRKSTYIIIALLIFVACLFYDNQILKFVYELRNPFINKLMAFKTNWGLFIISLGLLIFSIAKKKYKIIALILLAVALSLETSYLLKKLTQIPRPFIVEELNITALSAAYGFSFPSLHTTYSFALLPFLKKIFKSKIAITIVGLLLLVIPISRVYLGVHYLSDVIAGAILGYTAAIFWSYMDEKYKIYDWFLFHINDKRELRRQVIHLLAGIAILFILRYFPIPIEIFFIAIISGGVLSIMLKKYKLPYLYPALKFFERPRDLDFFPGKGAFFYLAGILLALIFFERNIAMAAIAIMAVGDAITSIIGTYFGKIKNPFNQKKHLEGTILAIIASTLAAYFFVSFEKAFLASTAAMLIESIDIRYLDKAIDDNVVIPIVAGVVMTAMI